MAKNPAPNPSNDEERVVFVSESPDSAAPMLASALDSVDSTVPHNDVNAESTPDTTTLVDGDPFNKPIDMPVEQGDHVSTVVDTQQEHDGNVSVTVADNEAAKAEQDENGRVQRVFQAGPTFVKAIDAALDKANNDLKTSGSIKRYSMSGYLRKLVADSIGFDLTEDPIEGRSKYATDAERRAAIKASQQKAAQERKRINELIKKAKNKSTRNEAITAMLESLGMTIEEFQELAN